MGMAIRAARGDDRAAVNRLLHEAFVDDPVSTWVFPDAADRSVRHSALVSAFLDLALSEGRVDLTGDGTAAALWRPVPAGRPVDDAGPALVREVIDPENERIELVGRLTEAVHPTDRAHEYLQLVAVEPGRQGEGLGGALISSALARCDREGVPAYLEASTHRSRRLYERLGFTFTGHRVDLPDGPAMWPMWRDPR